MKGKLRAGGGGTNKQPWAAPFRPLPSQIGYTSGIDPEGGQGLGPVPWGLLRKEA